MRPELASCSQEGKFPQEIVSAHPEQDVTRCDFLVLQRRKESVEQ